MNITNEEQFKTICRAFFPACEFHIAYRHVEAYNGFLHIARLALYTVGNPTAYAWKIGQIESDKYENEADFIAKLKEVKKDLEERGLLK